MSYPANAEQGQRMIDAASGNAVAPAGDVTTNRQPFNAEQAETLIGLLVSGGGGGASSADAVSYDNTASGLTAGDVQGAIDELSSDTAAISGKENKGKITISGVEKTANTHTVTIVTNGVTSNFTLVGVS